MCAIFGVTLLAGGIANAVYATDNANVYNDHCTVTATLHSDIEVCEDIKTVFGLEVAATVSIQVMQWVIMVQLQDIPYSLFLLCHIKY